MENAGVIILTGLTDSDGLIRVLGAAENSLENTCPLTMESIYAGDDANFLKETTATIAQNPLFVSNSLWEKTVSECADVENMGAVRIQKCGHEFSAVPLLYELMTKVFKCPICRGGSETEVTLDGNKIPANMPEKTWKILCTICTRVRDEDKRQKRIEENAFPIDMQMISIVDMYESMPWQMSFSLYRTENPSTNERPFVIIPIQMRMETHIMIGEDGIVNNTDIILRSGD
jgi:hypothetical protein